MQGPTDTWDALSAANAMIQYKVYTTDSMLMQNCQEGHVCFSPAIVQRAPVAGPPVSKRLRVERDLLQTTSSNALIVQDWNKDSVRITGVCVAGNVGASHDEMIAHPDTFARVTVQASGMATVITSDLDRGVRIGHYIAVSEDVGTVSKTDSNYATFGLVVALPNTRANRVLGRVCNIKSTASGVTELSVLLTLQTPCRALLVSDDMFLSESALFRAYVPPSVFHTLWSYITPNDLDADQTDAQSGEAFGTLNQAIAIARDKNMHQAVAALESAIYAEQQSDVYRQEFPETRHMSSVGMHAFLIGNMYTKGILWYYDSLDAVRSAIPLLLKHSRAGADGNAVADGMMSATMFASDEEMQLMVCFLNWSRHQTEHPQTASISNVKDNINEALSRAAIEIQSK